MLLQGLYEITIVEEGEYSLFLWWMDGWMVDELPCASVMTVRANRKRAMGSLHPMAPFFGGVG
jgi:hypothetical protein